MKILVKIDQWPNSEIRDYHVDHEITLLSYVDLRHLEGEQNDYNCKQWRRVGQREKVLAEMVLAIEGIYQVDLNPTHLRVHKGKAFAWEDIEASLIAALRRWFGETLECVVEYPVSSA